MSHSPYRIRSDPRAPSRQPGNGPCCGSCNAPWRSAERKRAETGEPHEKTARPGEPVWCGRCTDKIRAQLAALPELAAMLQLEIEHGTTNTSEKVSGSRERPLHERQVPARLIEEIAEILAGWEDDIREHRDLSHRKTGLRQGVTITAAARFLLAHHEWLMASHPALEAVVAFGHEIGYLHRRAQRAVKADDPRPVTCDGIACPGCDLKTLERELDHAGRETGYTACRNCGRLLTTPEYHQWTKLLTAPVKAGVAA